MKKKQKDAIERQLERLDLNERQKLLKQASRRRKQTRQPARRSRRTVRDWLDSDEDHEDMVPMSRAPQESVVELVGHLLEDDKDRHGERDSPDESELVADGVVTNVTSGRCHVRLDQGEELDCRLPAYIAETQKTSLAVGDEVVVDEEHGMVELVLPRRTRLSRPDPSGKKVDGRPLERVIAANVDFVVIVSAVKTPPLRVRLIDRYLVAIERGGALPVVCVNKMDLASDSERESAESELDAYRDLDIPVTFCSAESGVGVSRLREWLSGRVCAFVGHSGVGKSSLINALAPELDLGTGTVADFTGKGRHTTTASSLYELEDGTRVVDTPGIREFGLSNLSREELAWCFHEFDEVPCRFRDCSHSHEPGCGVREAVESGQIPRRRYETYLGLLEGIGG